MWVFCTGLVCHHFCAGLLFFVTREFEVDSKWKPRIWTGSQPHFDLQFLQRTWWSFFEAARGHHLSLANFGGNQIAELGGHRCNWSFYDKVGVIVSRKWTPQLFLYFLFYSFWKVVHSQTKRYWHFFKGLHHL